MPVTLSAPFPDCNASAEPPRADPHEATGEVVLRVVDCRAVVEVFEQRGVQLLGPLSAPAWGGELRAFLRDPDGHLVEISGPS